jgi:hypothetical protein
MPQNPNAATVAVNPAGAQAPAHLDAYSNLRINPIPALTVLDITAATVVKAAPGRIGKVHVVVPGSANGSVNDCLTTAQVNVTNQICAIPAFSTAQIAPVSVDWLTSTGIVVVPGTGQTLSVSYE